MGTKNFVLEGDPAIPAGRVGWGERVAVYKKLQIAYSGQFGSDFRRFMSVIGQFHSVFAGFQSVIGAVPV